MNSACPRPRLIDLLRIAALCVAACACVGASADELRVASSGGFSAALKLLAPMYEKATGDKIVLIWGPSMGATPQALPNRLDRGETIDAVVMVDEALNDLVQHGRIDGASKKVLARSLIAMAVRSGAPKPDISTVAALKQSMLDARSIAWSDSASGNYLQNTLVPRFGIADQLRAKSHMIPAEPVGEVVARGEADIGFQQLSELKPVAGIDIVGLIPEEVQKATLYSVGIVKASSHRKAAEALEAFLMSPEAAAVIRDTGLDPTSH